MKVRRPRHRVEAGDLPHVRAVDFHRVNLRHCACLVEPAPDDALAVRREKRAAVVAGRLRQARLAGTVGIHDVNFAEIRQVDLAQFFLLRSQVFGVGAAGGTEDNFFAVRRVTGLGVVTPRCRESAEVAAIRVGGEDVHHLVVVPRVTALLAGGAEVEFRLLLGLGLWVVMRRAKQHTPAARMKKCAGRLAVPEGDTGGIAGLKIDRVNLIERIAYLAFALENQSRAVRAVVTLAAAPPFKGQLPHAGEELLLSLGESRAWPSGGKQGGRNGAGRE